MNGLNWFKSITKDENIAALNTLWLGLVLLYVERLKSEKAEKIRGGADAKGRVRGVKRREGVGGEQTVREKWPSENWQGIE